MLEEMPAQCLLCHSSAWAQGLQQSQPAALQSLLIHESFCILLAATCAGQGGEEHGDASGGFESLSTSCIGSVRREISALSSFTALNIATFISDTGFVMPARKNGGVMKHWDE